VIGTAFIGNSATDGGGIANDRQLGMSLNEVIIFGNHATAYGGAIYNQSYFTTVTTQITRNIAGSGGGGIDDSDGFTTLLLTTTSVLDNTPDNCEPLGSIPRLHRLNSGTNDPRCATCQVRRGQEPHFYQTSAHRA
jgi:hypothetical protein